MRRLPLFALLVALVAALLVVTRPSLPLLAQPAARPVAQPSGPLRVVTSTAILLDMIQRVGGDHVQAISIVPPGADPHTYQPTPRDVLALQGTRLAIWNGLGLDAAAADLVAEQGLPGLTTVVVSDGIVPLGASEHEDEEAGHVEDDEHGHAHAGGNPHLWLDPTLAVRYVEAIRDALVEADPVNAAVYQQNAADYIAEIQALDTWAQGELAAIPPERRKLVTFHDAFPYLARHYGLELVGVVLKSPGREPSAQEVAALVSEIQRHQIPTVYVEPQFNARILELAAHDAGVQVRRLYSDALDAEVSTYLDLMRYNVRSLADGLR